MKTTNKRREYARRIHWYVQSFLFCLHNKLQTEKEYREGKYGSKVQTYFIEITCATSAEISRISTETAETKCIAKPCKLVQIVWKCILIYSTEFQNILVT